MKSGFVALVGRPNVGKSSILNRVIGQKVTIVSDKPQTTRRRIHGVVTKGESQIVFVDTPGVFAAKRPAERAMVDAAWRAVEDADVALVLVDAARAVRVKGYIDENTETLMKGLRERGKRALLALNKIDSVKRELMLVVSPEIVTRADDHLPTLPTDAKSDGSTPSPEDRR